MYPVGAVLASPGNFTVDVSTQLWSLFFLFFLLDNTVVTAACGSLLPGCVSVVLGFWAAAAGGSGCLSQPAPSSVAGRPLLAGIHHSNSPGCAVTLCLSRWGRSACSVNSFFTGCIQENLFLLDSIYLTLSHACFANVFTLPVCMFFICLVFLFSVSSLL